MLCPVCLTAMVAANAPAIAAAGLGGVAAVKAGMVCINRARQPAAAATTPRRGQPARTIVDPIKINRYDEADW